MSLWLPSKHPCHVEAGSEGDIPWHAAHIEYRGGSGEEEHTGMHTQHTEQRTAQGAQGAQGAQKLPVLDRLCGVNPKCV